MAGLGQVSPDQPIGQLTKEARKRLAHELTELVLPVIGLAVSIEDIRPSGGMWPSIRWLCCGRNRCELAALPWRKRWSEEKALRGWQVSLPHRAA